MLKGHELLAKVTEMRENGNTASEIVRACGYTSTKEDGTVKLHFTDFYTELLTVQGKINSSVDSFDEDEEENEDIIRLVREGYPSDAVYAFIELYGVECIESFADSYQGEFQSEVDFAQYFVEECYPMRDVPSFVVIDWQDTWDSGLSCSYDFEDGYVFRSDF
jgi:hypothetical protein